MTLGRRRLDPELVQYLNEIPELDFGDLAATRAQMKAVQLLPHPHVVVTDVDALVNGHSVSVRVTRPSRTPHTPMPAVLEIHGGGFALGSAASNDEMNCQIAQSIPCVVVAVDYRLAPECPYPAAIDDCMAALAWIRDHADELNVDAGRIALLGTSAGGCLAASVALRVRDSGKQSVAMQVLLEPVLDDRTDSPSMQQGQDAIFWNSSNSVQSWNYYLAGRAPDEHTTPARHGDLSGLPPTYLTVNELDPLRDQGLAYAARLLAAGVSAEVHCWPGTFHGFTMFDTELSRRVKGSTFSALRRLYPQLLA